MDGVDGAQRLYDAEQYQSCVQFCSLWVDDERAPQLSILMGEALMQLRQYRRALLVLRGVLGNLHLAPPQSHAVQASIAKCCARLGGDDMEADAIQTLCAIPATHRPLQSTLLLAQLRRKKGNAKAACMLYSAALQQDPFCLDAITGHIETTRTALLSQGTTTSSSSTATALQQWKGQMDALLHRYTDELPQAHPESAAALSRVAGWLRIQLCRATADYAGMRQTAREVSNGQGTPPYIMADVAESYYRVGRHVEAAALFKAIRTHDPCFTYGMDVYSTLLKATGQVDDLRALADTLVDAAPESVEAWIVASVARSTLPNSEDYPMQYALKAAALSGGQSSRAFSYIALLLVQAGHLENAVFFYVKALGLAKELSTYQGIVKAYVKRKDGRTALALAKESTQLFPNCATAWALMGLVYHVAQRYEHAKGHYQSALKLDAQCADALLHLCDLDCDERRYATAIARLKAALPSDLILLKLGSIYTSIHQYADARRAFTEALKLNPNSSRAHEGLHKLSELESRDDA